MFCHVNYDTQNDIQLSISAILLKASAQKNDGEVGAHELAQIFQRINCRHWCW